MAKDKFKRRGVKVDHSTTPSNEQESNSNLIVYLDPNEIEDNIYQPRLDYDEDKLKELEDSIKKDEQQSPIKVTYSFDPKKPMVVYGHRRKRACQRLGIKVKAFIEDISKAKLRSLALIENIQRDDLSVIELAISFDNAINDGTFSSQKQLAEATGYSQAKISSLFSLLKLQEKITKDLEKNRQVSDVTALALLNKLDNNHTQWDLYKRFRDGELDRKGLTQLVNSENIKPNSQCELNLSKTKTSFYFKPSKELTKKGKYNEYERFAKEKLEQLQKELEEKEKELLR